MNNIFLNNSFVPEQEALIPVTDRGLRFGDGVFETIAIHNGQIYQWEKHLQRLNDGLCELQISADISNLTKNANKLIAMNKANSGLMRITVTRGCKSIGYLPDLTSSPNIIIETLPPRNISGNKAMSLFISAIEKPSIKALPINLKTLNGLSSVYARIDAAKHDCNEALLLRDNIICEGSSSNIFWFKGDNIYTPSLDCGILAGTTRDIVISLSPYNINQGEYPLSELINADEIFMTSVSLPVLAVDRLLLNNGKEIIHKSSPKSQEIRDIILRDIEINTK